MLNPWLSFPLQAVRFGYDAQSMVVEQMMRLAGMRVADQKSQHASPDMTVTAGVDAPEAPTSPVEAAAPGSNGKHRQAAQKAAKNQKRGKSKHRRSK